MQTEGALWEDLERKKKPMQEGIFLVDNTVIEKKFQSVSQPRYEDQILNFKKQTSDVELHKDKATTCPYLNRRR